MARVSLRLSEGEADLGGTTISLQRDAEGALQLGGAEGPRLRPLRFGERGAIVRQALTARDGVREVADGVAAASVLDRGNTQVDPKAVSVLALHLAGAGSGGPGFAQEIALLARSLGWSPEQLAGAEAAEVDALAATLGEAHRSAQADASSWQRIVFQSGGEEAESAMGLDEVQCELARDLLERGRSLPDLAELAARPFQPSDRPSVPAAAHSAVRGAAAPLQAPPDGDAGKPEQGPSAAGRTEQQETNPIFEALLGSSGEASRDEAHGTTPPPRLDAKAEVSERAGKSHASADQGGMSIQRESKAHDSGPDRIPSESHSGSRPGHEQQPPRPPLDRFSPLLPLHQQRGPGQQEPADLGSPASAELQEMLRGIGDAHAARKRQVIGAPGNGIEAGARSNDLDAPLLATRPELSFESNDLDELADFIASELNRAADQRRVDP